jgi:hypothetical protein
MRKIIAVVILFFMAAQQSVMALEYFRGRTIIGAGVFVHGDKSILLIDVSGDKSTMSACATTRRFAIDSRSPGFKETVAVVMTAYAKGENNVDVMANNSCQSWENAQDFFGVKIGSMPW